MGLENINQVKQKNKKNKKTPYKILFGMWNVEKPIREIKYTRNISFPDAWNIVEQTHEKSKPDMHTEQKKKNKEKEETKQKQEELNKLIYEVKILIEIVKTITKETVKEHISNPRRT